MSTQLSGAVVVGAQNLYDQVSSPSVNHTFGELIYSNDGRAFRYARAGDTDLLSAKLMQAKAENTSDQNLSIAAAASGDSTIVTTSTVTVDENEYAGGSVIVTVTPGLGEIYAISGHLAAAAAALTINLADNVETALTTSSKIDLVANPYKDIIVNPTTATSAPIGVTVVALTSGSSGWIGVAGHQPVVASAAVVVGTPVIAHQVAGGDGAVSEVADGSQNNVIGFSLSGIAADEAGIIHMHLL